MLNSPATNPTCVNGLKAEYSPSSYLYLVANLGKDLSNNKSFRSSTTKSYSISSNEVPESILNIVPVNVCVYSGSSDIVPPIAPKPAVILIEVAVT